MVRRVPIIALAALTLPLGGCLDSCGNDPLETAVSPDGAREAIVFLRSCGATTAFSTQVSIVARNGALRGGGNVFVADGGPAAAPSGRSLVEVKWLGPTRLLITYDSGARVFEQVRRYAGVSVDYRAIAAGPELLNGRRPSQPWSIVSTVPRQSRMNSRISR
jgi:hypothetical protein